MNERDIRPPVLVSAFCATVATWALIAWGIRALFFTA